MRMRFIDGYSETLWKSLAVKALRMGWPAGLKRAEKALNRSTMKALMICGVFEDVFPAKSELATVVTEVANLDYDALCARATHHTRGLTSGFCAMAEEAMDAAEKDEPKIRAMARRRELPFLPPRTLNCFYTWVKLEPTDAGQRREVDQTPWTGMPAAIADAHSAEGRKRRTRKTVLSGHYECHAALAERLERDGWQSVRSEVHAEMLPAPVGEQMSFFQQELAA